MCMVSTVREHRVLEYIYECNNNWLSCERCGWFI